MACEPNLPSFGCCGDGGPVAARINTAALAAVHIYFGFGDTACGDFYLSRGMRVQSLLNPDDWSEFTTTYDALKGSTPVITGDEGPDWTANSFGNLPQGWVRDVPLGSGFVDYGKFRPGGTPDVPGSYQYEVEITLGSAYSEAAAIAHWQALWNQIDVADPAHNICNFSRQWGFVYNENGVIADTRSLAIIGRVQTPRLWCNPGTLFPATGAFAGFSMARSGAPIGIKGYTDMGTSHSGFLVGLKARVRMDKNACIWKWATPITCAGPNPPADGPCPEATCEFLPLPSVDNPDPLCPTVWPRYVEFMVGDEALPTSREWYGFGGCTACFTRP